MKMEGLEGASAGNVDMIDVATTQSNKDRAANIEVDVAKLTAKLRNGIIQDGRTEQEKAWVLFDEAVAQGMEKMPEPTVVVMRSIIDCVIGQHGLAATSRVVSP
jgi:hypothetical protein